MMAAVRQRHSVNRNRGALEMTPPKKSSFLKPTFLFPMGCVGILVIAFLIYYFPVTERQEASLNSRAFRSLGLLGDSFQNRVENYATVFKQAIKDKNFGT